MPSPADAPLGLPAAQTPGTQQPTDSPLENSTGLPGDLPAQLPLEVIDPSTPDEVFDRYAHLVRTTLGVPVALVSLVSTTGQAFPGAEGLPQPFQHTRSTGLSHSFCQHVVAHDAPLVVTDARQDPVLADNLAIADIGVIAYAGYPLHDADGTAVGSLCAIDDHPRAWSEWELDVLSQLATAVSGELVHRRAELRTGQAVAAERAAAARTAQVTESMSVGYISLDTDWRITFVNTAGEQITGASRDRLVGEDFWKAFPATVGSDFERHYRQVADTGQEASFDAYYPEPLNAWYEVRATPETDGIALYFLDITARRQAEQTARDAAAQISGLAEVALAMVDLEDVTDLVTVIAERGLPALGADGGAVAVHDLTDPEVLLSYVTTSYGPGAQADYAHLPLGAALPVCEAARTSTRVLVGDRAACLAYSPAMAEVVAATGSVAFASLPMRAGGRVIGVVTAGWNTPQTFAPDQVELLEAFAAQCAQALQRLQARDAERRAATAERNALAAERRAGDLARRAAQRQAALVTIAQALADAETEEQVLAVLGGQGQALLGAHGSGLCLAEPGATHVRTLATDTFDADLRAGFQQVPADFPMPIVHTAVTGTAHFHPDRAATVAAFPGAEALYTAAGVQASACLPLRARDRLRGSVSMAFTQARVWMAEERELLAAFAALTAQALDRIAAHEAEQAALASAAGIAETLQRSMLTAPPEPDHLQIAVRYAASAAHAEVGGDWYDAFITSGGLTSLVIGDVTGHDMRAAAVMGQLRNLVRGIAFTLGEPPAEVLAAVDRAAAGLGIDTVATAILAQVEQDEAHRAVGTRLLRWSNAGHLPPLLIGADGTTSYLEAPSDLVLGWDSATERHDHEVVLEPGSAVLLYTDGLVERRRVGVQDGLDWLASAVTELAAQQLTLEELCDALLAQVGDHLDDDVALLALRAHPEDAPRPAEAGPEHVPAGLDAAIEAAPEDGGL